MVIIFDEKSPHWSTDSFEFNKLFIKSQLHYAATLYRAKGYIYTEKVYDLLGIEWNPYMDNKCWILERDGEFVWANICDNGDRTKIVINLF